MTASYTLSKLGWELYLPYGWNEGESNYCEIYKKTSKDGNTKYSLKFDILNKGFQVRKEIFIDNKTNELCLIPMQDRAIECGNFDIAESCYYGHWQLSYDYLYELEETKEIIEHLKNLIYRREKDIVKYNEGNWY